VSVLRGFDMFCNPYVSPYPWANVDTFVFFPSIEATTGTDLVALFP